MIPGICSIASSSYINIYSVILTFLGINTIIHFSHLLVLSICTFFLLRLLSSCEFTFRRLNMNTIDEIITPMGRYDALVEEQVPGGVPLPSPSNNDSNNPSGPTNVALTLIAMNSRLTSLEQQNVKILTLLTEIKQMLPTMLSGQSGYEMKRSGPGNVYTGRM